MHFKSGFARPLLIATLCVVGAVSASVYWFQGSPDENLVDNQLLFEVIRGEFVSTITEPGEVESFSKVEIRCKVKARGSAGTAILKIVPEGTRVEKNAFLIQFDDTDLKDSLVEQQIQVAQNEAALIQAENDLNAARQVLKEYDEGTYDQELAMINADIAVALENLERARQYLKYSRKLGAKGFVTRSQLQADEFSVRKAKIEYDLAVQKKEVLIGLTQFRMREELDAAVKKLEASLKAAKFTLQLSVQREEDLSEQVANCLVTAPRAGLVVYANDNERDNSIIIEEGTIVRDGQEVIYLPDPDRMQVRTKVNDSKINLVSAENPVEIRLDSEPGEVITGKVRKVADFPLPRRWYQAPIEYEVFVDITEDSPLVKSGLRAKAKIIVDRQQDVLMIPASAIVRRDERYFAIAVEDGRYVARGVKIGSNNDKFVTVESGLEVGDKVLINPEKQRDKVTYPET